MRMVRPSCFDPTTQIHSGYINCPNYVFIHKVVTKKGSVKRRYIVNITFTAKFDR
jgi:hypothetical protein